MGDKRSNEYWQLQVWICGDWVKVKDFDNAEWASERYERVAARHPNTNFRLRSVKPIYKTLRETSGRNDGYIKQIRDTPKSPPNCICPCRRTGCASV